MRSSRELGQRGLGREPRHQHAELVLERQLIASAVRRAGDGDIDRARRLGREHTGRIADGLVVEAVADTDGETVRAVTDLPVRLVAKGEVEHHGVLGIEPEHFLDPYLVIPEIGDLGFVAQGRCLHLRHGVRVLLFEQRERLRLVEQGEQTCGADHRRRLHRLRGGAVLEIKGQDGDITFDQLKDVGAFVPADVQVRCRPPRERAHRQERRALCVRELKLPRHLGIGAHAGGVNGRDGTREADGGDAVGRHRNRHDYAIVQREPLDGFGRFRQRDGGGQGDEADSTFRIHAPTCSRNASLLGVCDTQNVPKSAALDE